jgi:ABC-type transport system substrate-binding protein
MGSGGEYLQSQFVKLGIDINLQVLTTTYGAAMLSRNFDVAATTTGNTSRFPVVLAAFYYGPTLAQGGQNLFGPASDQTLFRAFRLAAGTTGAASCKWYSVAQERSLDQAYWVPMAAPVNYIFAKGYTFLPGPRQIDAATIRPS